MLKKTAFKSGHIRSRRTLLAAAAAGLAMPAAIAPLGGALAADDDQQAVAKAVNGLRDAMLAGDGATLRAMAMDQLTYGHSNSRLEDKAAFVGSLDGKNAFKALDLSDHAIQVVGDIAVARHTFDWSTTCRTARPTPPTSRCCRSGRRSTEPGSCSPARPRRFRPPDRPTT